MHSVPGSEWGCSATVDSGAGGGVTEIKNLQITNCSPTSDSGGLPCSNLRSPCREISVRRTGLPLVHQTKVRCIHHEVTVVVNNDGDNLKS